MDWMNDRIDALLGVIPISQQLVPASNKRSRRLAKCAIAWKRLGDTVCGDVARFNERSPRRAVVRVAPDQILLSWEGASRALLMVNRSTDDPVFTYSSPQQKPNDWLQHGGTIVPRSKTIFNVRDSTNSAKAMGLDELSEVLLGPPLLGDMPLLRD
jgi:hypothetical protein